MEADTGNRPGMQYQEYTFAMTDAQDERTNTGGRRRSRRGQRGRPDHVQVAEPVSASEPTPPTPPYAAPANTFPAPSVEAAPFVRPAEIAAPADRMDVYCVHHMAILPEHEPVNTRTNMTTLRHLAVDHFGEATLFCDCLHNGPHEWPPSLQRLETAIELDHFLTDSTKDM